MNKYLKILSVAVLSSLVLMSCAKKEEYNSEEFKKTSVESSTKNTETKSDKNMAEVSDKDPSDKTDKFKKTMDEVHSMKQGGMKNVKNMYTDLVYVKSSNKGELNNIVGMGKEDWLYSKKYDTTVIVCNHMNTPAYVFEGKDLSDSQVKKVKEDMKKMMDMMGDHDGMMMEDMKGDNKMMTGNMDDHDGMMMDDMEMNMDHDGMMMEDNNKAMVEENKAEKVELVENKEPGIYKSYTAESVSDYENGAVLFFKASWCPSCTAADSNIKAGNIPEGVNILKVDYDSNKDLRKKYGVVSQHTFVYVDKDGNMIKKWVGGGLNDIIDGVR